MPGVKRGMEPSMWQSSRRILNGRWRGTIGLGVEISKILARSATDLAPSVSKAWTVGRGGLLLLELAPVVVETVFPFLACTATSWVLGMEGG